MFNQPQTLEVIKACWRSHNFYIQHSDSHQNNFFFVSRLIHVNTCIIEYKYNILNVIFYFVNFSILFLKNALTVRMSGIIASL